MGPAGMVSKPEVTTAKIRAHLWEQISIQQGRGRWGRQVHFTDVRL